MPNIVNQSFFVEPIDFPNLTHPATLEKLTNQINKYEPQCLRKILGYALFKVLTEGSQRMTDLLDGAEYTDGRGDLQKWNGLAYEQEDTPISLIANYIYYHIKENEASNTGPSGTVVTTPAAGTNVSPAQKMATAWNFFSDEVYSMTCFLWLKKDINGARVYPEFTYHQFLETRRISRRIDSVFSL